ncbi:MAG: ArsA-related P-loop ATPase [Polyangia bacterium]
MSQLDPSSLQPLLRERRILIVVGSGGVGKTTTAATLALLAALEGRKVLVLTIDPARRLADALGLRALGHDIQEVPVEKLQTVAKSRGQGIKPGGQLFAMMLDQKRAFDEVVKRYAADPKIQQRIYGNAIYQQISSSLAGSHEYAAMSKLYELAQRGEYDLLVLDTPPTENALDFLEAPDKVSRAIESEAIQWIMKPTAQAGSWGLRVLGMGSAFVLRGLARFVGSAFLSQMAEFFVEFSQVMAGFRERAREVNALLRRRDVSFVLVCSPESLSVDEALYFYDRLEKSQLPVGGCIVNRVHSSGPEAPADPFPILRQRSELAGYADDDVQQLAADLGRTYREQQVLAATDESSIARLTARIAHLPLRRVPMFERDIHDAEGIALVSAHLVAASG